MQPFGKHSRRSENKAIPGLSVPGSNCLDKVIWWQGRAEAGGQVWGDLAPFRWL